MADAEAAIREGAQPLVEALRWALDELDEVGTAHLAEYIGARAALAAWDKPASDGYHKPELPR